MTRDRSSSWDELLEQAYVSTFVDGSMTPERRIDWRHEVAMS